MAVALTRGYGPIVSLVRSLQGNDGRCGRQSLHVRRGLLHGLAEVVLRDNIVPVEHGTGPVAADCHRHSFGYARPHHLSHGRTAQIVETFAFDASSTAGE